MVADAWGIESEYTDISRTKHVTSPKQRRAVLAAMGESPHNGTEGPRPAPVMVVVEGETPEIMGGAELALEDGSSRRVMGRLPADLPCGYHQLLPDGGAPIRLIVGPARCHAATGLSWGWAVQVYAARSRQSWGIGDLADLRRLGSWASDLGARWLMCNPLAAPAPVLPLQASPYYPASRRFRNPLYLRVEEVPGASLLGPRLEELARAGRALDGDRRIDRDAVFRLKMEALEAIHAGLGNIPELDAYRARLGGGLDEFAVYCVLAERHGQDWRRWEERYRQPTAPGVAEIASSEAGRVRFHAWLQWLLDEQLGRAAEAVNLMQDLPIGLDVAGPDAWAWQDVVAVGARVGAPPDPFSAQGQDWGLVPFVPHRLRAAGYEPFIQTIRAALRHAHGLRVDHVMGLWRLFWIPEGSSAVDGVFVRYPSKDLLTILALESSRAGAVIVGEDLGTVGAGVRETMAERDLLSYKVFYFEPRPPREYPETALAAVTTHDLPTLAGLWSGEDIEQCRRAGAAVNLEGTAELRRHVATMAQLAPDAPVGEAIEGTYRALAAAPSAIVLAQLEDALAVAERPNIPSAAFGWPNWSTALPVPIEELDTAPLAHTIASLLGGRGAGDEAAEGSGEAEGGPELGGGFPG